MIERLVLASGNAGKLRELRDLLAPLSIEVVSQGELGIGEADEPHATFVENALAKARHASAHAKLPALPADSAVCVAALGGAPGVASAHFAPVALPAAEREAQRRVQDAANNALLQQRLAGVEDRAARFVCTLVALRGADDPEPLVATGRWHGELLREGRGSGGFGYDPLLYIAELGRSVAELDAATKNALSHRAIAARQMLALMREAWRLG